jgi:hypothetical protein
VSGGELMVSRAAAARVIQRLVDERHDEDGRGGRGSLARECASRLARNPATLERAIYRVLNGYERRRDGSRYRRRTIAFSAIDQILTGADATHLWYGPELVRWGAARAGQTQPRRYPRRAEAKLTVPEIRTAHERYLAGESLRALGRALWQQHGYASPHSCANALSDAFLREGLPTRDRIEATIAAATVHGMASRADRATNSLRFRVHRKQLRRRRGEVRGVKCAATVLKDGCLPRPCRNFALADGDYCYAHAPERAAELAANVQAMRARLPEAA